MARLLAGRQMNQKFDYVQAEEIFLFSKASRKPIGITELPINGSLSLFSWEVNQPEREVNISSLSSHEFKNEWNSTSAEVSYMPSRCEQGQFYL